MRFGRISTPRRIPSSLAWNRTCEYVFVNLDGTEHPCGEPAYCVVQTMLGPMTCCEKCGGYLRAIGRGPIACRCYRWLRLRRL